MHPPVRDHARGPATWLAWMGSQIKTDGINQSSCALGNGFRGVAAAHPRPVSHIQWQKVEHAPKHRQGGHSPDGKRFAAICRPPPNKFVLIDGKKDSNTSRLTSIGSLSTGRSFRLTRQGGLCRSSNGKKFIVINEDESDAFENNRTSFSVRTAARGDVRMQNTAAPIPGGVARAGRHH